METEHDSRLAKQAGGGSNSDGQAKSDSRGQDSLTLGQGYDRLGPEKQHLPGPYYLRHSFRNMKSSSTSKTLEGSSPKTNVPQVFKKNYIEPKESFEDSKEQNEGDHILELKSFTGQPIPFKSELAIPKRSFCKNCTKIFDKFNAEADYCSGCLARAALGDHYEEPFRELPTKQDLPKDAIFINNCHGGTVSTTDHDAITNRESREASRSEMNNRLKPLVNVIKNTQTSALVKNMDQIRKSKVLCSGEQSINPIKNLPTSTISNIKISFGPSTGEKKITPGKLTQSSNSPKTQSLAHTLMNNERISPEALNSQQQKPDSKKSLKQILNPDHYADHIAQTQVLGILAKKTSSTLLNNPNRLTTCPSNKPLRTGSRQPLSKDYGNGKRSGSNSGKS
ncbi:MAG: hypothetical protein IM572_06615, partial [Chitinophagaceae bacterium]|nr:hypothetical protein [Chitinophagaceae bacterium]